MNSPWRLCTSATVSRGRAKEESEKVSSVLISSVMGSLLGQASATPNGQPSPAAVWTASGCCSDDRQIPPHEGYNIQRDQTVLWENGLVKRLTRIRMEAGNSAASPMKLRFVIIDALSRAKKI